MESRLESISRLRGVTGKQIEHPGKYYRQYVGIVAGERKFIYINAFCETFPKLLDWQQRPLDACDGGDCFWSAVYDPLSGEFSDLQINGIA
jgi:hypothetical protein